jgi:hypothetical protein
VYLAIYDLSGIQNFIFQAKKLKEIVGASYLVSRALFSNIPELLGEESEEWKIRTAADLQSLPQDQGRIVYIGGGNALVLYGSEKAAQEKTRQLQEKVFLRTGGALRICYGTVEITDSNKRLSEYQKEYIGALDANKRTTPYVSTAPGFCLNELDNTTFEPVLYFSDARAFFNRDEEKTQYMTRSSYLKLKEEHKERRGRNSGNGGDGGYHNQLVDQFKGYQFKSDFKAFFREGDRNIATEGKRYLAFVHIDGNTMGLKIKAFVDKLNQKQQTVFDDLIAMRDLSKHISGTYAYALKEMVKQVYGDAGDVEYPFRPIIADGDDITFVCLSDKAFECVNVFVEKLNDPEDAGRDGSGNTDLPQPKEFSVGVGIAFANQSYPFSTAYGLAEELCKNAKKKARVRLKSGAIAPIATDITEPDDTISSVDFHVCSGEVITDIKDFRKHFCESVNPPYSLIKRPYHLGIAETYEQTLSFKHFKDERLGILSKAVLNGWVARSKLKGLRSAYGKGYEFAVRYGGFIAAREKSIQQVRKRKNKSGETPKETEEFFDLFHEPFDDGGQGTEKVARLFDALDVLDICGLREVTDHE